MRIGFCGHDPQRIGFLPRSLVDLTAQLVGLFAVHAPRCAGPFRFDLAQAFKEQHTARIPRAHHCDVVGHLVGGICIHAAHMAPELLITPLACHRLARKPLLGCDAFEMAIALLIQTAIGDKDGLNDVLMLPDGDHGQILDIEIDGHRDQIGIVFAVLDLFGQDLFGLREVQRCRVLGQDQQWTVPLPGRIAQSLLEIATPDDRVVRPTPRLAIIHLEPHKAVGHFRLLQGQLAGSLVERGILARPWQARLAFLLATLFPVRHV